MRLLHRINSVAIFHLMEGFALLFLLILYHKYHTIYYSCNDLIQPVFIYFLSVLFFLFFPKKSPYLFLVIVAFLCAKESYLGLSQLFGFRSSNHVLYSMTGSFKNPGPYGGFLSICCPLLLAQYIILNRIQKKDVAIKYFKLIVLFVGIIALIIIPSTHSRSSLLAISVSFLFMVRETPPIIKNKLKSNWHWLLSIFLVMGIGIYLLKKPSADGRFFINKVNLMALYENHFKGSGLYSFGGSYGSTQARYFSSLIKNNGKDDLDWTVIKEHERITADCPDNAFNEFLFVAVEEGLFGFLLFAGIIIGGIIISMKRQTIWCYGLISFSLFALFSFPLHLAQFQLLLPVLIAACVYDNCKIHKSKPLLFSTSMGMALLFIISLLSLPSIKQYKQSLSEWNTIRRWYRMEFYEYVVDKSDSLLPYLKNDTEYLFAYGHSLSKIGNYQLSDSILMLGAKNSSDPMFWNVMGNNSMELGNYHEAEERYKHAFYMVPNRLYPLVLLAKLYYVEGDTARFLEMTDVVENFVPKVESIRTEKLRAEIRELKKSYLSEIEEKNEN